MGGKTKQSQRTKNNVKPSSSSRSAELLNNGMNLDGGFVSLGSGKPLPPLFPTLAAANLEQGLNPEFQMCIKKLNKKDPITRAKALQELCELVNKGDVEDVVAALPSWAHFYKILTVDTDRKVRELTQVCHGAIVRVCGRRTAPQLKALLPAWLQAQYDDHAPAQTHAHKSLTNTFPDNKLPEVISFCKAEVMAHLLDNLIGNAEAVLSKRVESAEERSLQLSRVITSSLQGLEYLTLQLPRAHDDWLWAQLAPLLAHRAYWAHARAAPAERAAWCGAAGRAAERFGAAWGAACGARALRELLCAPRDAAPAPHWACLLLIMHNVPNWHIYLDKKELLVKRILDVLENGGWGDARHLTNMLLPLLAHLPQEVLTKDFYEAFFNAFFAGLDKKNILNSKSERQSWITSLAECLRYLSIQQNEFVLEIATCVHRIWLEKVLSTSLDGQIRNNLIKCSATNMTSLVKYWLKQSKEENNEKYDQLVRNFWQNINSTVLTQIDKSSGDHNEIIKTMEAHILLLQTLKSSFSQEAKKQQSIKFDDDVQPPARETPAPAPAPAAAAPPPTDAHAAQRYQHNLQHAAHNICCQYFDTVHNKQLPNILTPLITLLIEFDSEQLFLALSRQFHVDSVYHFYEKVLRTWLSSDTMRCKAVVDIVFLSMKYMTEEEQDSMFDTFKQLQASALEWCVRASVAHPARAAAAARRWLRGAAAAAAVAALPARAASGDAAAAALLRACVADAPDGEALVSSECVSAVVGSACAQLGAAAAAAGAGAAEAAGAGGARLLTALLGRAGQHHAPLALHLFRLGVLVPRGDSRLSLDTWCEIRSSWQDGVAALPKAERKDFLQKVAAFLHEQLFQNIDKLDIIKIENMVCSCPYLFHRCDDAEAPDDVSEIVNFIEQIFDMKDPESHIVESYALRYECVTSQLNCLHDDDNDVIATIVRDASNHDVKELSETDFVCYANKNLFRAIFLRTLLLHKIHSDDEEEEPSEQKTWCDALLKNEYVLNEFCKVVYNYVVINSLHEGYAFWRGYEAIVLTKQKLECAARGVAAAGPAARGAVWSALHAAARARGYWWALAAHWLQRAAPAAPAAPHTEHTLTANGYFHSLQASTKWSSEKEADYKMKYLVMLRSWYAAHGELLPRAASSEHLLRDVTSGKLLNCDVTSGEGTQADVTSDGLDVVLDTYYAHNHTMLYERDISDAAWSDVVSNVAVVEFLTSMVTSRGWDAPARHWDFTTITLCSLLSSVEKSKDNWGSTKVSMLSRAVLRLHAAVCGFVRPLRERCERQQPAPHVADLMHEWKDIFEPDITHNLFSIIVHVLDTSTSSDISSPRVEVIACLLSSAALLQWEALRGAARGALGVERLARTASAALRRAAHRAPVLLAHALLQALAKPLVLDDAWKLSLWSDESVGDGEEEKERPTFCLDYFHEDFTQLHDVVDAALSAVALGEGTCELVGASEPYNKALGCLLLADAMHTVCGLARGDLTHHYIQIYRERAYAEPQLSAALRLLPDAVFSFASDPGGAAPAPAACAHMFLQLPQFSLHEAPSGGDIGALACRSVYSALCGAGCGAARGWWSAAAPRAARLLERVVRAYVAPPAARAQLRDLQARAHDIPDAEIRIAWSTNEVTCIYNVEERFIELRVWLSPAHPLAAPRLAAPDAAGPGANTHWVALYLAYQNGTLLNALKMWTAAVSAKVEAAPQCYICYCRLHPASGRLPRVPCHQCRNKFHNLCLRKWFATSNKSSCPLCRSAF